MQILINETGTPGKYAQTWITLSIMACVIDFLYVMAMRCTKHAGAYAAREDRTWKLIVILMVVYYTVLGGVLGSIDCDTYTASAGGFMLIGLLVFSTWNITALITVLDWNRVTASVDMLFGIALYALLGLVSHGIKTN